MEHIIEPRDFVCSGAQQQRLQHSGEEPAVATDLQDHLIILPRQTAIPSSHIVYCA